ncbi:hypothetical protein CEXT_163661 [Caerostris extrusa]|uniref:Uncharacterized protein n=1 Tax=Caerostris extrusa TaxID=172846 RepID=A0AAV4M7Y9_CAEEX|nr:hypothetical protein CEXT_163661 [Caerostris extrusa]
MEPSRKLKTICTCLSISKKKESAPNLCKCIQLLGNLHAQSSSLMNSCQQTINQAPPMFQGYECTESVPDISKLSPISGTTGLKNPRAKSIKNKTQMAPGDFPWIWVCPCERGPHF